MCTSLVSGEAKYLCLHLQAIWILLADECHCPVFGKGLVGVSSPPPYPPTPTSKPQAQWLPWSVTCTQAAKLCFLQDWPPREAESSLSDPPGQPELGLVQSTPCPQGAPSPAQKSPLLAPSTSPHQRDFRNQICLKGKKKSILKFQTHPANKFQG